LSTYRRKHSLVEARQHEGLKIVVNSALKGNQGAAAGDYLVTDPTAEQPKGSVFVVSKADFERDHELVDEVARAEQRGDYPDYVSHKEVSAAKITSVEFPDGGDMVLHLEGFDDVTVSHDDQQNKPSPKAGWYLIIYSDGYMSFSPAETFEAGYTLK
jgi:hypothetical protein